MAYLIGIGILFFIFTNPAKFFKQLFGLAVLGLCIWLAFVYTANFFMIAGGIVGFILLLGMLAEWSLLRGIKKLLKKKDVAGVVEFFLKKDSGDKKTLVEFLSKSRENNNLLKYIFFKDFFQFASARGSGGQLIFEMVDFEKHTKSIWTESLPSFNYKMITDELERFYPDWTVSVQSLMDQGARKRVDLIKLECKALESKTIVIDMDED